MKISKKFTKLRWKLLYSYLFSNLWNHFVHVDVFINSIDLTLTRLEVETIKVAIPNYACSNTCSLYMDSISNTCGCTRTLFPTRVVVQGLHFQHVYLYMDSISNTCSCTRTLFQTHVAVHGLYFQQMKLYIDSIPKTWSCTWTLFPTNVAVPGIYFQHM